MPRRSVVNVVGVEKLRADLKRVADDAQDLKDVHQEVGQVVVDTSHELVPILTGRLDATTKSVPSASAATIKSGGGLEYGGVIHFGWAAHNIAPTPYLYEAVDARREEVLQQYEQGINEITDRV